MASGTARVHAILFARQWRTLAGEAGAEHPPTTYLFDPHNPVPALGGNVSSQGTRMFPGRGGPAMPRGLLAASRFEVAIARNNVLVFQTPPLPGDVEVTGRQVVKLWAS